MKSKMKIAHMLTNFVSQNASLLSSVPLLMIGQAREPDQKLEVVSIRLDPKHTRRKPKGENSTLLIVGLMGGLLLSGCTGSTYSSHFDCPMGEGAGCASISRVNKMIDRQEIELGNDDAPSQKSGCANQLHREQVYVYYGPDQLSRLISTDDLKSPTNKVGN